MLLITMAHRGEAQALLDSYRLINIRPNVFEGDRFRLLLTGEGPVEAATRTALELGRSDYERVMNLGIAASLDRNLAIASVQKIRTVYLVIEGKPQFKSMSLGSTGVDCLTSFERIHDPEKSRALRALGSLVDRELWGVAFASKEAGVPCEAYKMVSDFADEKLCHEILNQKDLWAEILQKLWENVSGERTTDPELPEGFHFTFSSRLEFLKVVEKLTLREGHPPVLPLAELRALPLTPKERTKKLLAHLNERLDPFRNPIEARLSEWTSPFRTNGISLKVDPAWEAKPVEISFTVSDDAELTHKLQTLRSLSLQTWHEVRDGKIHVE